MSCPPPESGITILGEESDDEELPVIVIRDPNLYDPNPWPVTFMALGALGITLAVVGASGKRSA